ncbi:type II toxin-antitoxin system RelE/ParE family toxin [Corynebacterium sp. HMSC073D01]|nr:type II toxin-antitoxin system RelE/ParE family toxin [Corynebacterium sp. HMSC073D01]
MRGLWRWRVRDYRILASIRDRKVLIAIVGIGHRSTVYDL